MKSFVFVLSAIFLSVVVHAQVNTFKNKQKKQPGTTQVTFTAGQINGNTNLKSANTPKYSTINRLQMPATGNPGRVTGKILINNLPVFIEKENTNLKSTSIISDDDRFFSFFNSVKNITLIENPESDLKIEKAETDQLGMMHFKSVQLYKGIEIYGSQSTLHIDTKKERFTGTVKKISNNVDVIPELNKDEAIEKTIDHLKQITVYNDLSKKAKEYLKYDVPESKLVVYQKPGKEFTLAYEIEIRPNVIELWKYFIDAHTGEVLHHFNSTKTDGPATANAYDLNNQLRVINTYLENGSYLLADLSQPMYNPNNGDGMILTFDANNTSTRQLDYSWISSPNNTWSDAKAVSAHANMIATYKYFLNTFGRNSVNGDGGTLIAFINVADDDGSSMANAFWNGEAAFFGNGGGYFKPLSGAQDVISHELGHGVVGNTAILEYYAQSGAINETYADVFGSMVDREDWLIGEDIVNTQYFPSGALRNMSNPHNGAVYQDWNGGWQPAHVSEMYIGEDDNAGVHRNSSIGNFAYYQIASNISKEKAEQIFYRALVFYLTKNSQFIDFRIAVVQAAKDLYGENSAEAREAAKAFDQVGIYDEGTVEKEVDYEVNSGEDFLMSYDTDILSDATLYKSTVNAENFVQITATDMKGKVSITDDGSALVFAATDDYMKYIIMDGDYIEEGNLSNDAFWDNVAISKDGNRVAGISTEVDTTIYVFNLASDPVTGMKFKLYNPTTSHYNTNAGGVLYADVIEFDHTGEYLLYDACNVFSSTSAEDIYYWDIGFMKVWDNQTNDFGDGRIEKLFGSLPEKISVGNPVFSKNSPYIIAFDYFDNENENYAILGANTQTGDIGIIFNNSTLGYPSFSKYDDKIAFSYEDAWGAEKVAVINLANDKINASGEDATALINDAKWPVYYTTGERALGLMPMSNFTVDYKSGSAPMEIQFIDLSMYEPAGWQWSFEGGTPATSSEQNPLVTYNTPGSYQVALKVWNDFGENTKIKQGYINIFPTAVDDFAGNRISFYPNPANDELFVNCQQNFEVRIYDLNGRLLLSGVNEKRVGLSGIQPGIYMVEINSGDNILRERFVKQ